MSGQAKQEQVEGDRDPLKHHALLYQVRHVRDAQDPLRQPLPGHLQRCRQVPQIRPRRPGPPLQAGLVYAPPHAELTLSLARIEIDQKEKEDDERYNNEFQSQHSIVNKNAIMQKELKRMRKQKD